jgi:hypothetical protein
MMRSGDAEGAVVGRSVQATRAAFSVRGPNDMSVAAGATTARDGVCADAAPAQATTPIRRTAQLRIGSYLFAER